jgi:hypothetical protein
MNNRIKTTLLAATTSIGLSGAASADVIADFVDDFPTVNGIGPQFDGTETTTAGWDYMWNPLGVVGVSADYQSLVPNTVDVGGNTVDDEGLYTNVGNVGFNAGGQGNFRYGRIGIGTSHPGVYSIDTDYRAIYAYTIQAGEAGIISIADSSLVNFGNTNGNGIDLDVYVNDTLIAARSIDGFNSFTATDFDGSLGTLSVGDTVYVTVGHNGNSGNDAFVIDYSLEVVPEPGSLALLGLGGLIMLRRRRH